MNLFWFFEGFYPRFGCNGNRSQYNPTYGKSYTEQNRSAVKVQSRFERYLIRFEIGKPDTHQNE